MRRPVRVLIVVVFVVLLMVVVLLAAAGCVPPCPYPKPLMCGPQGTPVITP